MKYALREIEIENYKSIEHALLRTSDGKVVLVGKNNVGKTNILEFICDILRIDSYSHDNPAFNSKYGEDNYYLDPTKPMKLRVRYKLLEVIDMPEELSNFSIEDGLNKYLEITFTRRKDERKGEYIIGDANVVNPEYVKKARQKYFNALFITPFRHIEDRHYSPPEASILGNISLETCISYFIRIYVRDERNNIRTGQELIKKLRASLECSFIKTVAPELSITVSTKEDLSQKILQLKKDETNEFSISKEIAKSITITVKERPFGKRVRIGFAGEGVQNLLIIQMYLELNRLYPGNCILLIDEIENNLHPPLIKKVLKYLMRNDIQLIMSTHSPIVASELKVGHIHYLKKETKDEKFKTTSTDLKKIQDKYITRVTKELNPEASELFFSDKVLLVEGPSDKIFIQKCIDLLYPTNDITILMANSRENFRVFRTILDAIGIKWCVIADKDFFESSRTTIHELIAPHIRTGKPEEDAKLLEKNGIFFFRKGELEDYYPLTIMEEITDLDTKKLNEAIERTRYSKVSKSTEKLGNFIENNIHLLANLYLRFLQAYRQEIAIEKTKEATRKLLTTKQSKEDKELKEEKTSKIYKAITKKGKPELALEIAKRLRTEFIPFELKGVLEKIIKY